MTVLGTKVPYLKVKGSPADIGHQTGINLRERIQACFEFYTKKLLVNPRIDLQHYGGLFLDKIGEFYPQYAVEIEAIAYGAQMKPWQLGVLNARTEIFIRTMDHIINECTTCFFRHRGIFGENWDWMIECEDLIVLMEIEREDGHRIMMVAEPGIIGKIGFNSKGLGVGLNILHGDDFEVGVPVHILLRAALDSDNLGEVRRHVERAPFCTFSNILVADEYGNYLDMELAGRKASFVNYGNGNPIHTNHYLACERDETNNPMYQSSVRRMDRVHDLESSIPGESLDKMKTILLDTENGKEAICADFMPHYHYQVGTVSSMIVDLPRRNMLVTKGSPLRYDFQEYNLR